MSEFDPNVHVVDELENVVWVTVVEDGMESEIIFAGASWKILDGGVLAIVHAYQPSKMRTCYAPGQWKSVHNKEINEDLSESHQAQNRLQYSMLMRGY